MKYYNLHTHTQKQDGTKIRTWGGGGEGQSLKPKKKIMKIKTNIYFIFNKILYKK